MEPASSDASSTAPKTSTRASRSRTRIIVSVLVVGASIAYLLSQSFGDQMVYEKYVHELVRDREEMAGRTVRVGGDVVMGSIENRPGTLEYRFRLTKEGQTIPVHYTGIVPDTFREGISVVAQGRLLDNGSFEADQVIAKCPSKYEMSKNGGQKAPHAPHAPSSN